MYADAVNAVVARMNADVDEIFELFGAEAEDPPSLLDQLTHDAALAPGGGRLMNWGLGTGWPARAARLLRDVATNSDGAPGLRSCVQQAFDDPDARVRGVAWCVLAKLLDSGEATERVAQRIIADEFKQRIAGAAERRRT